VSIDTIKLSLAPIIQFKYGFDQKDQLTGPERWLRALDAS